MLRLLTLLLPLLALIPVTHAAPDNAAVLNDADQMRQMMQHRTSDVLQQAEDLSRSPEFLNKLQKKSSKLVDRANSLPKTSLPVLPDLDPAQHSRARAQIDKLFRQVEQNNDLTNTNSNTGPQCYVFVSFSMPELTLRRLMHQAQRIGAPLVLRGMVENDMNKTRIQVGKLLGADKKGNATIDGGLSIDPTLFDRFGITVVPAFVLTDTPVPACTQTGCPTPDFVRLAGDVTLAYALESFAREVPAMHDHAQRLLANQKREKQ